MEDDSTDELDIKGALAYGTLCGFTDGREGFDKQVIQAFTRLESLLKFVSFCLKFFVI